MGVLYNLRARGLYDSSTSECLYHAEQNDRKTYPLDRWGLTESVNLRRGLATILTMVIMVRATMHPAAALHRLLGRIHAKTVKAI